MAKVKKYLFAVVLGVIVLILTVAGLYMIVTSNKKVADSLAEVDKIKSQLDEFTKSEYSLTPSSVEQAEANRLAAEKAYKDLLAGLVTKTAVPPADTASLTPIGAMDRFNRACFKMENMLTEKGLAVPDKTFTFGAYMDANTLPRVEEIPLILKNMEVTSELIYLVANSGVSGMTSFSRSASLDPSRRDLFNFISFSVVVTGDLDSIKNLMSRCNSATYNFYVRAVTITSPSGLADTGLAEPPPGKIERLINKQAIPVTASLQIDYVEFHEKE